jgi:periplasmic protein CpxP/Spy
MGGLSRFSSLAVVASLTLLLGGGMVSNVYAEGDQDGSHKQAEQWKHGKHFEQCMHGRHHERMFKGLNFTKAQKEQVKTIMKGHRKEFMEGKIAVLQARQNLMAVATSGTFDESAVQRAYSNMSSAQEKMIILHAKVFGEIMPILTPEQQAVVQGRLAKSKLHMQKVITKLQSKLEMPTK